MAHLAVQEYVSGSHHTVLISVLRRIRSSRVTSVIPSARAVAPTVESIAHTLRTGLFE